MGVLEQVTQLKKEGASEKEIINKLQEQGISPKAITDAMDQAKIKEAVSKPFPEEGAEPSIVGGGFQPAGNSARAQESPSVPNDEFYIPQSKPNYPKNQPPTQEYQEAPQDYSQQDYQNEQYYEPSPQENYPDYNNQTDYGQQAYYPQEGYGQDYYSETTETDTMMEIAEQVVAEKLKKIQKQVDELNEFKTLTETKLTNALDRLKRIESSIDKLQIAILEKIGSYGTGIESIKKEMTMMQDSFSKTLPILVSKHSSKNINKKTHHKKISKTVHKKNN